MSNPENFREYPRILKIEEDGKIIALDKNGEINTDLNIYSIDDEKQRLDVIDVNSIFVSYIHSIIYFIIGIIAFHKAIIYSKKNGLLGHY